MDISCSPVNRQIHNGGSANTSLMGHRPAAGGRPLTEAERQLLTAHVGRLLADADAFFTQQQQLLRKTYSDMTNNLERLKYRAQFFVTPAEEGNGSGSREQQQQQQPHFAVPMPLSMLTAASAAAAAAAATATGAGAGSMSGMGYGYGDPTEDATTATPLANRMGGGGVTNSPLYAVSPLGNFSVSQHHQQQPHLRQQESSPTFSTSSFQVTGSNQQHNDNTNASSNLGAMGLSSQGTGGGAFSYSAGRSGMFGVGVRGTANAAAGAAAGPGGLPAGAATSTPPNRNLGLTTDSKSPSLSMLIEDGLIHNNGAATRGRSQSGGGGGGGAPHSGSANGYADWGSLGASGIANQSNGQNSLENTQHMMASPQFTNTMSLDDLLARFAANTTGGDAGAAPAVGDGAGGVPTFSFDALYEQLVGSGEKSRSPENNAAAYMPPLGAGGGGHGSSFDVVAGHEEGQGRVTSAFGAGSSGADLERSGHHPHSNGGGSLFDRNVTPAANGEAPDRRAFGTAQAPLFGLSGSNTPTKPTLRSDPAAAFLSHSQRHQQQQQQQHGLTSSSATYSLLNGVNHKDVIPIDSIRNLCDQHLTETVRAHYDKGRPIVSPVETAADGSPVDRAADDAATLGVDASSGCQVLVEFKRKRVLQYDSDTYVSPGTYVVVGGDRGEDIGLVIYAWCEKSRTAAGTTAAGRPSSSSSSSSPLTAGSEQSDGAVGAKKDGNAVVGIGLTGTTLTRSIGVGNGTVLRRASEAEVAKLLRVQAELETRAVDVCGQHVLDHALPMVIVDAEYQFDRKKLTFFYEAQQRMDFRDLVRDLYKTFHARIWMELVDY